MAKKKFERIYTHKCTITDKEYKLTKQAKSPDELLSVNAYYEMNPEEDDRPEHVKIKLEQENKEKEKLESLFEE